MYNIKEELIIAKVITPPDRQIEGNSTKWANWMSKLTPTTCSLCRKNHGRIIDISLLKKNNAVNAHPNCLCVYVPIRTKIAGTATTMRESGADIYLMKYRKLPDYYINKKAARQLGWNQSKGNLAEVLPNKQIGGDEFFNDEGKLPVANGRTWFEADFNYIKGHRNDCRIMYSNDGLFFVTYDHYKTFYELKGEQN